MKPSEKRALEAEKRRLAEERAASEMQEQEVTSTLTDTPQGSDDAKPYKPYKRKEGFFQSHIRLITFIITATLVLTVLGPLGIDMLVAAKKDKVVNNKKDIDITTVYSIYDNADVIEWKNFRNFNYTDYSYDAKNGEYYVREYPISNSRLVLKVGGSSLNTQPDYVYLIDYRSGEYIDVLKNDPRDFVKSTEQETEK